LKKWLILLSCNLGLAASSQPLGPNSAVGESPRTGQARLPGDYWQQEVNYSIDVRLNTIDNSLDGFIKLQYINHSPDTLRFIWMDLGPNAYKNDKTAFSDQMLENGRTDFYFSDPEQKGYINHLDFRINGAMAETHDHPEYIEVIKLILPHGLAPKDSILITTPFHEKLPFAFSGYGYNGQLYQIKSWYPKPAVYDQDGWHPIPLLNQGGHYSEFGNFDVRISAPGNFVIACSGELQNEAEKKWMLSLGKTAENQVKVSKVKHRWGSPNPKPKADSPLANKTLRFVQIHADAFSWFASDQFIVQHDTIGLASGRIVDAYCFYKPGERSLWKNGLFYLKRAVRYYSATLGEYPDPSVSLVGIEQDKYGDLQYPAISSWPGKQDETSLDLRINHSLGLYWVEEIIGPDGRQHPWMTQGMSAYYDSRYRRLPRSSELPIQNNSPGLHEKKQLAPIGMQELDELLIDELAKQKLDQPISSPADSFSRINYHFIAYAKSGLWIKSLEDSLGLPLFDSCLHAYFQNWHGRHPAPQDFKTTIEGIAGQKTDRLFERLDETGLLDTAKEHKRIEPTFLFSTRHTDKINYVGIAPVGGYNLYDQLMIGLVIHNYNLPSNNFQFILAPVYAFGSRQFNGIGKVSYSWYPDNFFRKLETGLSMARFSTLSGTDSNNRKIVGGFEKLVPFIRLTLKNHSPRASIEKWIEFKMYGIAEKGFNYVMKSTDSINSFPTPQKYSTRYLNQLTLHVEDYRVLYPYDVQFQVEQASQFYRLNLSAHYFFNYSASGGMSVRFFAAKFGYLGEKTSEEQFNTAAYQPKLTASRGYLGEDYTYSNYFLGRSEFTGFASQQIMMKDGGLKIRTDLFQDLQGRSDNWIAALNFNTTLPRELLPAIIPLRIFADVGTYAGAWGDNPLTSKFLYVGGLQLTFFKGILNIYAPIIYSSDFSSNLKTVPEENTFWKKISFSIDIQDFNFRKIVGNIPVKND
jgi:hypothetical protein